MGKNNLLKGFDKNSKIPRAFEKIKQTIENKLYTIKDIKEYIQNLFEIPDKYYDIVNKPIDKNIIGDKIGLILSGGGARGIAHLGVLKALLDLKIKPSFIVGTSAGAIMGALYSSGMEIDKILKIYEDEEKSFKKLSIYKNLNSKNKTEFLKSVFNRYLPVKTFEELNTKLSVQATDIKTCERVIFSEGDLIKAILASSAIPFVFEPVKHKDYLLVDGGVLDFFGFDIARKINNDFFSGNLKIIISDVSGITDKTSVLHSKLSSIVLNVSKDIADIINLLGNEKRDIKDQKDIIPIVNNLIYILRKGQRFIPPLKENEFIISPQLEKMSMFSFGKYHFAYEKGVKAVMETVFDSKT